MQGRTAVGRLEEWRWRSERAFSSWLIAAVAFTGRQRVARDNREKMEVLSRLDGQEVILWLSSGGRVQTIVPRRGQLRVGDGGASSVGLAGDKDRLVFLGQIRWIEDPKTGTRFGDRRWGKLHQGHPGE